MAPNQAARRAARRDGSDELDSGYEKELYDQLPPRAQADVADVARALMNMYDMPLDIAMPSANRIRREERALFDRILHQSGEYALGEEDRLEQVLDGMEQILSIDTESDTTTAKGKGKGKGFEPFSGTGRRLNDLDS